MKSNNRIEENREKMYRKDYLRMKINNEKHVECNTPYPIYMWWRDAVMLALFASVINNWLLSYQYIVFIFNSTVEILGFSDWTHGD